MNRLRWWLVSGAGIPWPCASAPGSPALTPPANALVADRPTSLSADRLFIRSLVGLDRNATKELFAAFLAEGTHTATQIRYINAILDELTSRGVMEAARLYDPPFSDLAPLGPEDLFAEMEVDNICQLLDLIKARAMAVQAA